MVSEAPGIEELEIRLERRLAEVELRHHKQWERLAGQRQQDCASLDDAKTTVKRAEQDVEVLAEWQRGAAVRLEALASVAPRVEEALALARSSAAAAEEVRKGLSETRRALEEARSSLEKTARGSPTEIEARLEALKGEMREDAAALIEAKWGEWDRREAARRRGWERDIEEKAHRAEEAALLQERVEGFQRQLADQQEEVREIHEWVEEERTGCRADDSAHVEARLTRFEGILEGHFDELAGTVANSRADLRREVQERVQGAVAEISTSGADVALARKALTAEIEKLQAERAAIRQAWEWIDALRHDGSWNIFVQGNKEWQASVDKRLTSVEDEVAGNSDSAVWTELGRLGCRVADLHSLIDDGFGIKLAVEPGPGLPARRAPNSSRRPALQRATPTPRSATRGRRETAVAKQREASAGEGDESSGKSASERNLTKQSLDERSSTHEAQVPGFDQDPDLAAANSSCPSAASSSKAEVENEAEEGPALDPDEGSSRRHARDAGEEQSTIGDSTLVSLHPTPVPTKEQSTIGDALSSQPTPVLSNESAKDCRTEGRRELDAALAKRRARIEQAPNRITVESTGPPSMAAVGKATVRPTIARIESTAGAGGLLPTQEIKDDAEDVDSSPERPSLLSEEPAQRHSEESEHRRRSARHNCYQDDLSKLLDDL